MLKYEEMLHFDKYYKRLQSNNILQIAIGMIWGSAGYILLYFLIKYVLLFLPDFQPWDNFETWFTLGGISFLKIDFIYFAFGLILNCYGNVILSKISVQKHSAKSQKSDAPKKLLINGYYAKVRHPMYGTFILLQAGFMLSLRSFIGIMLALLIAIFQYMNAAVEEKTQLVPTFGEEYNLYVKKVKGKLLTKTEIIVLTFAVILSAIGFAF